jgi:hypothetical protein
MAVLSSKRFALDTRIATVALAFAVAIVTMPMMCGLVITDAHCTITADICHPAQSVDAAPVLLAPTPKLFSLPDILHDAALAHVGAYHSMVSRLGQAPDLPPPKARA